MSAPLIRAAAVGLLIGCGNDAVTSPPTDARIVIAPPSQSVFAGDVLPLAATVIDANGNVVPGASISWSLDDSTLGEISVDRLTLFKPGTVTFTATSGALTARRTITVQRLSVLSVTVGLPAPLPLSRGDAVPLGVKAEGEGGRIVLGRLATLSSDDPAIALIDPSGRVRAVAAGVTTIRATIEGVSGTLRLEVSPQDVVLTLSKLGDTRLPAMLETFVDGSGASPRTYEVWLEAGQFSVLSDGSPRYDLAMRSALYEIVTVNGQRTMQLVSLTTERDRGTLEYDARGDMVLRSQEIGNLTHTAASISGGFLVRYRVPGGNDVRDLFYRRQPE